MKIGWERREDNGVFFDLDAASSETAPSGNLEILYVLQGNVSVFKAQEQFVLSAENITVFNPYEHRSLYYEAGSHTITANIVSEKMADYNVGWLDVNSTVQVDKKAYFEEIRRKLALICKYILDEKDQALYIKSELLGILAILSSEFRDEENYSRAEAIRRGRLKRPGLINDVTQYIFTHYSDACSLRDVAAGFYVSESYLSRLFVEKTGVNYSDYLNRVRMMHARKMLLTSWTSVTDIALACGFGNVNTFISNFRKEEGITPAAYRKRFKEESSADRDVPVAEEQIDANTRTRIFALLKHAGRDGDTALSSAANHNNVSARIELNKKKKDLTKWNRPYVALHMGYASGFFSPYFEETARRMSESIPYRYLFLTGIFDDTIDVCTRRNDGSLEFRYSILDRITDFILSLGLYPWYELVRTPAALLKQPEKLYDGGYIQLPAKTDEWCLKIDATLRHFIDRYGEESVSRWRLTIASPLLASYDVFTMDNYMEYYSATMHTIRNVLPAVVVTSGTFDPGLLKLSDPSEPNDLVIFLKEARRMKTLPDELALQCFNVEYRQDTMDITLEKLRRATHAEDEPATPSRDPDQMAKDIRFTEKCMQAAGVRLDISIVNLNSSIWNYDLGCDTCFKSAFYIKNYLENSANLRFINHNVFFTEEAEGDLFSGGPGAVTAQGIPKALANAMMLVPMLGDYYYASGPGWFATGNRDKTEIQIILYQYEHYNFDLRLDEFLPKEEQIKIDRYAGFENHGSRNVNIMLTGMKEGRWSREDVRIDWERGSSYDIWKNNGSPRSLTREQARNLMCASVPGRYYEELYIDETNCLRLSFIMEPFSVRLITLKQNTDILN